MSSGGNKMLLASSMNEIRKLCRICAKMNDYMLPIYKSEGLENNLSEIMQNHLPILLSATDNLPLQLCYKCASTLLSWQELIDTFTSSDALLRSHIKNLEKKKLEDTKEGTQIEYVQSIHERSVCERLSFNDFYRAQRALCDPYDFSKTCLERLELLPSNDITICKNSDKHENRLQFNDIQAFEETSDIRNLENYESCSEDNISTINKENDQTDTPIKFNKESLVNIYQAVYELRNHYEKVHNKNKYKNYSSSNSDISSDENDICDNTEPNFNNINGDSSTKYDDLSVNNRRRDFFDADTRDALNKAKTILNGKLCYVCPICGKDLRSTHTYIFHMRIHSGEKPCICHLCGKQFRVNAGLQRHVKETHHKIKMHACDTCGRSFVNRQNLIQHLRIHTGERPYVCSQCGKRFKQSGSLYIHSKTHSDYYPFQCNTCDAKFRQRSGLTHHMYKHTGEKPNVCTYCGKGYRVKHELNIHMLMHTNQRPYVCPACGLTFRQRRTMRNHCKKMHDCNIR